MKLKNWQHTLCAISLAAAASAASVSAQAATITFEGVAPGTILLPGDAIIEQGFSFTAFDGAGVVDTFAAFGPGVGLDLAGPGGNVSQFYIGLNDSFLQMRAINGRTFKITGLEYGFVSALTNLFNPGDVPGFLIAAYEDSAGGFGAELFSFGAADPNGAFSFQGVAAGVGALAGNLRVVDFYACTADANGQCASVNANFSQFALDNIQAEVPEPGSLALVLAALALTAGLGRRKA